jgi:hypothetical protein
MLRRGFAKRREEGVAMGRRAGGNGGGGREREGKKEGERATYYLIAPLDWMFHISCWPYY